MKTFVILFAIAISLPSEAQRVRENVKQRAEIISSDVQVVEEVKQEPVKGKGQDKVKNDDNAKRK